MQISNREDAYLASLDRKISEAEENIIKFNNELKTFDGTKSSVIERLECLKTLISEVTALEQHRMQMTAVLRKEEES